MGNINYDSFYKFLVSIGILLFVLPFTVFLFLCSDSFDLTISEQELLTYTETARKVIVSKQTIPMLINNPIVKVLAGLCILLGLILIVVGLIKWYGLQKIEDSTKEIEFKKMQAEADKYQEMPDEQVIQNFIEETKKDNYQENSKNNIVLKAMLVEQRFVDYVKQIKPNYIVKKNIRIKNYEYDVIAFSNQFLSKDYIYEVKYCPRKRGKGEIIRFRDRLKEQREVYAEETSRLPYTILALVTSDDLYDYYVDLVGELEKWNNFSIEVIKESAL